MSGLSAAQRRALADLRPKDRTDVYYRQTAPPRDALDLPAKALVEGRWHRKTEMWPIYAGDSELSCLLEQARHTVWGPGDPPVLTERRVSQLNVTALPVLDLFSPSALATLKLTPAELRADGAYPLCQALASDSWATHPRAGALLVPSAVAEGLSVLVIHQRAISRIAVASSNIRQLGPRDVP